MSDNLCPTCGSDALASRSDCMDGDLFCLVCDPPEGDEELYTALSASGREILDAS